MAAGEWWGVTPPAASGPLNRDRYVDTGSVFLPSVHGLDSGCRAVFPREQLLLLLYLRAGTRPVLGHQARCALATGTGPLDPRQVCCWGWVLSDRSGHELLESLLPPGGWTACPGWAGRGGRASCGGEGGDRVLRALAAHV